MIQKEEFKHHFEFKVRLVHVGVYSKRYDICFLQPFINRIQSVLEISVWELCK